MQRVLLISNARASSVSARTREVIFKALQADFKVEVVDTKARDHATELAQDAVDRGFDAVLAFGGDGTVNECAQAAVATDIALGILPGGNTNVMARSLGIPLDPVEATAYVAERLRSNSTRVVGVGRVNARYFLFAAGMGLDAEVVKRADADPKTREGLTEWRYLGKAVRTAVTEYRGENTRLTLEVDGHEPVKVLFCVCGNARPFTYFKGLPIDVCPSASLDKRLDFFALDKVSLRTVPRIAWSVFVSRSHPRWKHGHYFADAAEASWRATEPLAVQVDGEYVGDWDRAIVRHVPDALRLLT